jgi:uncharacterized delta-60 repeat protein
MRSALRPSLEPLEDRCLLSGGVLDPTFGTGGLVTTAIGSADSRSVAVATYPQEGTANDGKIVAVGNTSVTRGPNVTDYLEVVRYNLNGTLDSSFGGTGEMMTVKGVAAAVAVQPDGKVVVAGSQPNDVVRFNADGTLDMSFGSKGVASMAITRNLDPSAGGLVLQPDGKIIVAGLNQADLAVERFNSNGTLDASFGSGGIVTTSFTSRVNPAGRAELALDPNTGQIVVVAPLKGPPGGTVSTVVVRYNTDGSLDTGFGSNPPGYVTLSKLNFPTVAVQSDDRVVVAGEILSPNGQYYEIGLDRLTATGAPDNSFGTNGAVVTSSSDHDVVRSVTIQANGQILVGGTQSLPATLLVARYNTDGSLDSTFGTNGIAMGGSHVGTGTMALEPDGRIVLAGYTNVSGPLLLALARFLATGPQIGSFTASPNLVAAGSSLTLTASGISDANPGATVTQVAFYVEMNGVNTLLGDGTQSSPGVWTLTFAVNLAPGSYTLLAVAQDSDGVFGDPVATSAGVM